MRMLVACEFSGIVRDAFASKGWDAWSCDLLPTERPGNHIQDDVLKHLNEGWDLMIAHPPCTYLARSGWHWVNKPDCDTEPLKGEPRRRAAMESAGFFYKLLSAGIPHIAVENPRPIHHVKLPKPTQTIQPWEFGEQAAKATCLWLNNLPPLMATIIEENKNHHAVCHKEPPGPDRKKNRSRTYPGIAAAMADQWTAYITQ